MAQDDLVKKAHEKLVIEAGKATARAAWDGLRKAVGGLADDFLGFAEKGLDDARAVRGIREDPQEDASPEVSPTAEAKAQAPDPPPPVDEKALREEKARDELEILKAKVKAITSPATTATAPAPIAPEKGAYPAWEAKAREELEALKAKLAAPTPQEPIKKTL